MPSTPSMRNPVLLKSADILSVLFLGLLLVLCLALHGRIPGAAVLELRYLGVIALVSLVSYAHSRRPAGKLFLAAHVLMPLFVILFTFDSMAALTRYVNPPDKDALLAGLDYAFFGTHPGVWMERFISPLLTTMLQLCYTSYYFLPVSFCLLLYFRGSPAAFDRTVFGMLLGFFVSYAGYILVPAFGPRIYMPDSFGSDLMRGPVADGINDTLNILEGENRDAFPSGHTQIVVMMLLYAWSHRRWFFWMSLPLVTGLIISTVYLRYHYAVDVIAGMMLAPMCVWAAGRLYGVMNSRGETQGRG